MLIAIPSDAPGGLDAPVSDHFGHCAAFTVVTLNEGEMGDVQIHPNGEHVQGGCMAPVMTLKNLGVDTLLAGGMGMRPLAGFQQVGIKVHSKERAATVREAVELFIKGECPEFGESQTCGGGGGGCGSHDHDHDHHHHVRPVPIEGKADVRDGRLVTMTLKVNDTDGNLVDSSDESGPMQYLQGSGGIVGLEKAIAGHEAGDHITAVITPEDGFGERDEGKIMEVPVNQLPPNVKEGQALMAQSPDGHQIPLVIMELGDEMAKLDANHPLAGKKLVFDATIIKVEGIVQDH